MSRKNRSYVPRAKKPYTTWNLICDFLLTSITGGAWLVWIIIRYLRTNSR